MTDLQTALSAVARCAGMTKTEIAASAGWPHSKLMRIVRAYPTLFREVKEGNTRAGHTLLLTKAGRDLLESQAQA